MEKNSSFLHVVMFRLCMVQTSVNSLQKNDVTKNQSERLKNYRTAFKNSSEMALSYTTKT